MENEINDTTDSHSGIYSYLIGGLVLVAIATGAWYYLQGEKSYSYAFVGGETVSSWNFQGAYTGKPDLEEKAVAEIARLEDLLGVEGDDNTDYILFVGIANQYRLMGDGESEFTYLKKALAIDSVTTGLAWHNVAVLLADRGAPRSARDAFKRAVDAQSQAIGYQTAYIEFLTENFKDETGAIEESFLGAEKIFGDNASLLEIKAHWLDSVGRFQDAIDAWEKVKVLSPAAAPVVDSEIARLKAQL